MSRSARTPATSPSDRLVNAREIRVIGLSRSGNHAVIQWICAQLEGRYCFLNCVQPKENPFLTAREMGNGQRAVANYPLDLREEAQGRLSRKDCLLYSYEDCFLGMVASEEFERQHDQLVGCSQWRRDVLVLRDAPNLFASRLKSQYSGVTRLTAIRIWKQHARQFLGERSHLNQPVVPISYNHWATRRSYRQEVAEALGLAFSDAGRHEVPVTGGGSSFDGRRYDGQADQMETLSRWRRFRDDPEYLDLFDEEVLRLNDAIFAETGDEAYRRFLDDLRRRAPSSS